MALMQDYASRALDAVEYAIWVLSSDLQSVLLVNRVAQELAGEALPARLMEAVDEFVIGRGERTRLPARRIDLGGGRAYYLRVTADRRGSEAVEIVALREEALREPDLFRALVERYQLTAREYQIVTALRLGKTNRQIGVELELTGNTVASYIHRLLERLSVKNRTGLVHLVEELIRNERPTV